MNPHFVNKMKNLSPKTELAIRKLNPYLLKLSKQWTKTAAYLFFFACALHSISVNYDRYTKYDSIITESEFETGDKEKLKKIFKYDVEKTPDHMFFAHMQLISSRSHFPKVECKQSLSAKNFALGRTRYIIE